MRITMEDILEQARRDRAEVESWSPEKRARLQATIDGWRRDAQALRDSGYYDDEKL